MKGKAKAKEFQEDEYKIHVTGRDVFVTEAMKNYAIEKVGKIERFSHRIIDVAVTMEIQKLEHRVDIVMRVDHVKIKAQASSTDMYTSIDTAVDRIKKQLTRYKTRINDHTAKALKVTDLKVNVLKKPSEEEVIDVNLEIEEENRRSLMNGFQPHEIVSQETRPLKTLTYNEALMKMELSGDVFLLFKNEKDLKINLLYRRKDENYGLIEVEV